MPTVVTKIISVLTRGHRYGALSRDRTHYLEVTDRQEHIFKHYTERCSQNAGYSYLLSRA